MNRENPIIRLAIPKGRMQGNVFSVLSETGIKLIYSERGYRPKISLPGFEVKILKPQNIIEMLSFGSRDIGFAGADWVKELNACLIEILDTGLDPVRLVAAVHSKVIPLWDEKKIPLTIASEYENLTKEWIKSKELKAMYVKSFGATEVFPPEDADIIVDITATGNTLRANHLKIIDTIMHSSTRLYANPKCLDIREKRERIEHFALLVKSVLEARNRVMLEVNVSSDKLESVISILPCMREPTLAPLHGQSGYAVKAAIPKDLLPRVIIEVKQRGGTDLVITNPSQIVP